MKLLLDFDFQDVGVETCSIVREITPMSAEWKKRLHRCQVLWLLAKLLPDA